MNLFLFILFLILTFYYLLNRYKKFKVELSKLPPLVPGRLIFGNYFDIDPSKPHLSLTRIGQHYQDMFTISIFGQLIVVLNSPKSIIEFLCCKTLECADRPNSFLLKLATNNFKDLVFSRPNLKWLQIRTAFHKFFSDMKKLHDRRDFTEVIFFEEWSSLYSKVEENANKNYPIDLKLIIYEFQTKIITSILFGNEIARDNNMLNEIKNLDKIAKRVISNLYRTMLNMNPFEGLLDSSSLSNLCNSLKTQRVLMNEIFKTISNQSRNSTCSNQSNICVRSLIDLFTSLLKTDKLLFDETHIKNVLTELLFAGIDGIVNVVNSLILFVSLNKHAQNRVYKELKDVKCDYVGLNNKRNTPFTEACILETLRLISQIPLGIFRKTLTKIYLMNYEIPEETIIVPNLWKLHHDPLIYSQPFLFKPERFMDNNGKLLDSVASDKMKFLLVFGCGKRICPGKNIAFNLIYLYVSNLIKNFEFKIENDQVDPDPTNFILNSNLEPKDFKVSIKYRNLTSSMTSLKFDQTCKELNRKSEIKTLCTDRNLLINSIKENKLNFSEDED